MAIISVTDEMYRDTGTTAEDTENFANTGLAPTFDDFAVEHPGYFLYFPRSSGRIAAFLYRNLDDIVGRNRRLRDHFGRIVDTKLAAVEGHAGLGLEQVLFLPLAMPVHPGVVTQVPE